MACDTLIVQGGDTTKDRIKALRKALNLTQAEFAERTGIKQNTVATYEMGRNPPTDTVITLIVREFGVNETWLRTGVGEMFERRSADEQIAEFAGRLLEGRAEDAFKRKLVSALSRLDPVSWAALERVADEIAADEAQKKKELP